MALTAVPTNSTNQKFRIFSLLYHISLEYFPCFTTSSPSSFNCPIIEQKQMNTLKARLRSMERRCRKRQTIKKHEKRALVAKIIIIRQMNRLIESRRSFLGSRKAEEA